MLFFLHISKLIWMKFVLLPRPVTVFKPMLNLVHMISIHRRKLDFRGFMRKMFSITSRSDA